MQDFVYLFMRRPYYVIELLVLTLLFKEKQGEENIVVKSIAHILHRGTKKGLAFSREEF